jgi:biotin synthase-like enzyme
LEMVRTINKLEMEVCCTLDHWNQAQRLAEAGLYAYNHNLDTSEEYYKEWYPPVDLKTVYKQSKMFAKRMLRFVVAEL